MQWIQDPSQSNVDTPNKVRRDADISGTKRRHIGKLKLRNWKLTVRSTISGTFIGALMTSRRGSSLEQG